MKNVGLKQVAAMRGRAGTPILGMQIIPLGFAAGVILN